MSLARRLLSALPDSPALKQCLAAAPPQTEAFAGHVWLGPDQRPRIALDGLGVWELALPGRRATYAELRELRTPQDVRPVASHVIEIAPASWSGVIAFPLKYHPGAWLMVAVTAWPKGGVRYDAWLWHAGRRRALALWWEESQRVTDLFRDCAASWFWVGPPPDSAKPPDPEPRAVPTARAEEGANAVSRTRATGSGAGRRMLASWIPIASLSAIALVSAGARAAGAGPEGYFPCPVIVFFEPCPAWGHASAPGRDEHKGQLSRQPSASGATPAGTLIQSLWAEPSASPDDRGQVYVPPRAVREFLESPTPERAEAYLAWNRERLRAIGRAAEVLASVGVAEEGQAVPGLGGSVRPSARPGATCAAPTSVADAGPEPSPLESRRLGAGTQVAAPSGAPSRVKVVYAFSSWCPYSGPADAHHGGVGASRPDLAMTGILFDSPPAALPLARLPAVPGPPGPPRAARAARGTGLPHHHLRQGWRTGRNPLRAHADRATRGGDPCHGRRSIARSARSRSS